MQRRNHAGALDVTHQRVLAEHFAQTLLQVRADVVLDPRHHAFIAQGLEVGNRHRRRHRVSGIGQAVGKHTALLHQHRGHFLRQDQAAHGDVARGQALGDGQGVRLETEVLVGEPFAGATEAADNLIGAQQHIVLAADALDFRPVAFRREDHAAGALERFGDKARDLVSTQFEDLRFQLLRRAQTEFCRSQVAFVGEEVRLVDVLDVRNHAAHFVHELHAAQRRRGQGRTVVTVPAADHDLLLGFAEHLPVTPHRADQHLVGLGAGVGVDRVAVVTRQQAEQQLGQLDHLRVGGVEKHVVVRQLFQLPARRGGQVLAPVTEVGAPQPGHAVEVTSAIVVPQVQALATDHHPWPLIVEGFLIDERMDVVRSVGGLVVAGITWCGHRQFSVLLSAQLKPGGLQLGVFIE
ncbi:hypothetical protein D3C80_1098270 [compost metagenome]